MEIDLGKIFSRLFKRKKKEFDGIEQLTNITRNNNLNWEKMTADAVLNCCEQIGIFEDLKIADGEFINKICQDVADLFNSGEKTEDALSNSLINVFANNSIEISKSKANLFVDCYLESYVYNNID